MSDLDVKGRCCGRKPLVYKKKKKLFCPRCDKEFSIETKKQIPSYFWMKNKDGTFTKCDWMPS
jgi:hypothetical protein